MAKTSKSNRRDLKETTEAAREERRGRPQGREREEGDIDRAGQKGGLAGERAGSGRPSHDS